LVDPADTDDEAGDDGDDGDAEAVPVGVVDDGLGLGNGSADGAGAMPWCGAGCAGCAGRAEP
jgi:hypothetical protein